MRSTTLLTALWLTSLVPAFAGTTASFENPPAPTPTENKPSYLYFKKGTITREGKNKLNVELELAGKLPNNLSDTRVAYHLYFDIDNNGSTGSEAVTFPGFGSDIAAYLIKPEGSNRFDGSSSSMIFRGRGRDIRVSKVKVSDDKVSCELNSELFGEFPSLRVYAMSYKLETDRGVQTSLTWVDQLPRKGAMTLTDK